MLMIEINTDDNSFNFMAHNIHLYMMHEHVSVNGHAMINWLINASSTYSLVINHMLIHTVQYIPY